MAKLEAAAVISVAAIAGYLLWKMRGVGDVVGGVSTFATEKISEVYEKGAERTYEKIYEVITGVTKHTETVVRESAAISKAIEKSGLPFVERQPYQFLAGFEGGSKFIPTTLTGWLFGKFQGMVPDYMQVTGRDGAYAPPGASVRAPLPSPMTMGRIPLSFGGSSGGSGTDGTYVPPKIEYFKNELKDVDMEKLQEKHPKLRLR